MKFLSSLLKQISQSWRKLDPLSLQVRLSVGIAAISSVGLGSVAIGTSWQMQQILIESHKQNIEYITERLPRDVELYSEMFPVETSLVKAIDNLTTTHTLLWIKGVDGKVLAASLALRIPTDWTATILMSLPQKPLQPRVDARAISF